MNANELRIGNWLKNNNAISEIFDPYHRVIGKDISDLCENPLHEAWQQIEGIPLTPEILEKAGFVVGGDDNEGVELLIPDGSIFIEEETSETYFSSGYSYSRISTIENVHQLQNLYFALTGEELEINL